MRALGLREIRRSKLVRTTIPAKDDKRERVAPAKAVELVDVPLRMAL